MAQFLEIKARVPDALLFFRMGDFYELFFEDAVQAAGALDITLTKRGKYQGTDIPMCGVPFHAYENYLARLIKQGFMVAICEQIETPEEAKKRGGHKAVVQRDIVRIVTQGTLTEDTLLDARSNNFLGALSILGKGEEAAIACVDVSTGEFFVRETTASTVRSDIAASMVSELIVPEQDDFTKSWSTVLNETAQTHRLTYQPPSGFALKRAERQVLNSFSVASLDAFGQFSRAEISAMGAILSYLVLTQAGRAPSLQHPRRDLAGGIMAIDATTRASLELHQSQNGGRKGSLVSAIDKTVSGPGARLLAARIGSPLTSPHAINSRYEEIAFLSSTPTLGLDLTKTLKELPDMARALSRLSLDRGGPRDMQAIKLGLENARTIATLLHKAGKAETTLAPLPENLVQALDFLEAKNANGFSALIGTLSSALTPEAPMLARDGGFVQQGYDLALDDIRTLRDESRRVMAGLEQQYKDTTAIKALKIRQNIVLGFFIEVPASHGDTMLAPPHDETFIHRQTMANAVRFTTGELADLDTRVSRARDEALARELEIYEQLLEAIRERADDIRACASAAASIDVALSFAKLALEEQYIRPEIDESLSFTIEGGRHPVVEQAVKRDGGGFIANDCELSDGDNANLWLVTGPNMAGKSTFLRQNALIAIIAQAGGYVPATKAHIGIADRVFSRVGASDDLARGRSTFMVEMVETAAILNQAGDRALVVLDEIGRGTSTFDGLSIAWAAVEHLHDRNRCRGLFATHYHELTALEQRLARLRNVSMKVREWKGDVVFLHEVGRGAADRSYGVAVARLAGVPAPVIKRASEVLGMLEERKAEQDKLETLPLFAALDEKQEEQDATQNQNMKLKEVLERLNPDTMAPREALDALYELKSLLDDI